MSKHEERARALIRGAYEPSLGLEQALAAAFAEVERDALERAAGFAESFLWNIPSIKSETGAACGDAIRALKEEANA